MGVDARGFPGWLLRLDPAFAYVEPPSSWPLPWAECLTLAPNRAPRLILLCSHSDPWVKAFLLDGKGSHSPSPARDPAAIQLGSLYILRMTVCPSCLQSILPLRVPVQSRAPPCSLPIQARAHSPLCCVYRYHRLASWVLPPDNTLSLNQPVWFLCFLVP